MLYCLSSTSHIATSSRHAKSAKNQETANHFHGIIIYCISYNSKNDVISLYDLWIILHSIYPHLRQKHCVLCNRAGLNLRERYSLCQLWSEQHEDGWLSCLKKTGVLFEEGKGCACEFLFMNNWKQTPEAINFLCQIIIFLFYHTTHIGFVLMWVNAVCG